MTKNNLPRIGIIGAGRLGTALARQSLKVGYEVRISNSRGPESLELLLGVLLPGAIAATIDETVAQSEIIILAFPLRYFRSLKPNSFDHKIVIDAMNYWAPVEGHMTEFAQSATTSSEIVQSYLPTATVIKSLNHVAYSELEEPVGVGSLDKARAIGVAGDDAVVKKQVMTYVNQLGFTSVDVGTLKAGQILQPDTQLFNSRVTAEEMRSFVETVV